MSISNSQEDLILCGALSQRDLGSLALSLFFLQSIVDLHVKTLSLFNT